MSKKKCSIFVGEVEHKMLTDLSDYMDKMPQKERKVKHVHKILKDSGHITPYKGVKGLYTNNYKLPEIKLINKVFPGLVSYKLMDITRYDKKAGRGVNLYSVTVNSDVLGKTVPRTADMNFDNTFERDMWLKQEGQGKRKSADPGISFKTQEEAKDELHDLTMRARIKIEGELKEIEDMPPEQKAKKEKRLKQLKVALADVNAVEDLFAFVAANELEIGEAVKEFELIMAMPIEKRASLENLNRIQNIKETIDSMQMIQELSDVAILHDTLKRTRDKGKLDTMLDKIKDIQDKAQWLDREFVDQLIPILAESYIGYHHKSLDGEVQKIIDNIEETGNWRRWSSNVKRSPEFKTLNKEFKENKMDEENFNKRAKEMVIDAFKGQQYPDRKNLIRDMRKAHKDKSAFSYYFDPLMYSSEPLIQMFGKSIKEAEHKKNDRTRDLKYELAEQYKKFVQGKNEADIEALYDSMTEVTTISMGPGKSDKKVLSLVSPTDDTRYLEELRKGYREASEKYDRPMRKDFASYEEHRQALEAWKTESKQRKQLYYQEIQKWHHENSEPIEGWRDEKDALDNAISKAKDLLKKANADGHPARISAAASELEQLNRTRAMNFQESTQTPKGDWVGPKKSKYANKKYQALMKDEQAREFYEYLKELYREKQKNISKGKLVKNTWHDMQYMVPSIRKHDYDRLREQVLISTAKDMFSDLTTVQDTQDEFANYNSVTGEIKRTVPLYYMNMVDAKEVSKDLASSIYQFSDMIHNYEEKSKLLGQVNLFVDIIKNRDTLALDSKGGELLSSIADKMGYTIPGLKPGDSYTYKHVRDFVDSIMFGQRSLKQEIWGLSLNDMANGLATWTAMSTLSFNMLQGVNQSILDNMILSQEIAAGQFFDAKNLAWGKTKYWGETGAVADIGKFAPETKLGKAIEFFDALTEFTDSDGKKLVGGKLRKALQVGNLMVVQQAAEHEVATTRMLAAMDSLRGKLLDKDGKVIQNEKGEDANLYDLLVIDEKGKMSVDPRVANFDRYDFINMLQALGRRTNQTKGNFDSAMLKRQWYGKLMTLFRSWVVPGVRRRYGHNNLANLSNVHIDEELGTVTQGMYVSLMNLVRESYWNKTSPLRTFKSMTVMEQQNVKRTMMEMAQLASMKILILALASIEDDDDNYALSFMKYQNYRLHSELQQWLPFVGYKEVFRIAKSPIATARHIEKAFTFLDQIKNEMLYSVGWPMEEKDIFYMRKTGSREKGDRKIWKELESLLPILRGMDKTLYPEEPTKYFLRPTYN